MSNVTLLSVDVNVSPEIKGSEPSLNGNDNTASNDFSQIMQRQLKSDKSGNSTPEAKQTDNKKTVNTIESSVTAKQKEKQQDIQKENVEGSATGDTKVEETTAVNEINNTKEITPEDGELSPHKNGDETDNKIVNTDKSVLVNITAIGKNIEAEAGNEHLEEPENSSNKTSSGSDEFINMLDKASALLVAGKTDNNNEELEISQKESIEQLQKSATVSDNLDDKIAKKSELAQIIQQALANDKSSSLSANVNSDSQSTEKGEPATDVANKLAVQSIAKTEGNNSDEAQVHKAVAEQKAGLSQTAISEETVASSLLNAINQKVVQTNELATDNNGSLGQNTNATTNKITEKTLDLELIKQANGLLSSEQISDVEEKIQALTPDELKQLALQKLTNDQAINQNKINSKDSATSEFKVDKNLNEIHADNLVLDDEQLVSNESTKVITKSADVTQATAAIANALSKDIEKQASTSAIKAASEKNSEVAEDKIIEQLVMGANTEGVKPKASDIAITTQSTVNHAFANIHSSNHAAETINASQLAAQLDSIASSQIADADLQVKNSQVQLAETINIHRKDFAESIKSKVMILVNQKLQQVDIRLDPPELGSMQIKVNLQNDAAAVSFVVQNPQAKEALEQHMSKLKEMLNNSGVDVGDTNVEQQKQNENEQQENFAGSNGSGEKNSKEQQSMENSASQLHAMVNHSAVGVDFYA